MAYQLLMAEAHARIAVVDDDSSVRKALGRLLGALSFDVRTFASGAEFLSAMKSYDPQCIILDLHMPGFNGLDVQRRLMREGSPVPVIVISGHDNPLAFAECQAMGVRDCLSKPIEESVLLEAIERAISNARTIP